MYYYTNAFNGEEVPTRVRVSRALSAGWLSASNAAGSLKLHMAHFQLGSFLIGLVSNWAQF